MHSHSHYICLYIIIYTLYTDVYSTHILQATERIAPCGIHCDIPGFGRSLGGSQRVCNSNRKKPWWDHHERGLGKMLSMIIRDYPCWTRWLSITIHYLYYQHVSTIVNNWSTIINNLSTIIRWMIFLSDTIITIIKKITIRWMGWFSYQIPIPQLPETRLDFPADLLSMVHMAHQLGMLIRDLALAKGPQVAKLPTWL
jgi:hypothetical protein